MKRIIFYNSLIIIALSFGCNKIDVEPKNGEPVFVAEAKFDGIAQQWQAGEDGYYMFSSYKKDVLGVYEYIGTFAQEDTTSGKKLSFHIRDAKVTSTGLPDVSGSLDSNISFMFASKSGNDTIWSTVIDTIGYQTTFDASSSILPNIPVIYEWDFGDTTSALTDSIPVNHSYTSLPNSQVKLTITAQNNICKSSLTKSLNYSGGNTSCELVNIDILPQSPTLDSFLVTADFSGLSLPYTYSWSNGGTNNSVIIVDSLGVLEATVTIVDGTGCSVTASISTTYNPGTVPPICLARFYNSPVVVDTMMNFIVDTVITGDNLQLSRIKIEYTNEDGVFYSSYFNSQPSSSFIKILKVDEYDRNENDEKTKKITLQYACRIWTESGEFIDISDGNATIAVAYPD